MPGQLQTFERNSLLGDLVLEDYRCRACDVCQTELAGTTCPSLSPSGIPTLSALPSVTPSLSAEPLLAPSLSPGNITSELSNDSPSSVPIIQSSSTLSIERNHIPSKIGQTYTPTILASSAPRYKPSDIVSSYPSISISSKPTLVPSAEPSLIQCLSTSSMPSELSNYSQSSVPIIEPSSTPSI